MNSYKAVRNLAEAANSVTNKGLISEDWGPWPSIPPGLFRKDVFKPQPIHNPNPWYYVFPDFLDHVLLGPREWWLWWQQQLPDPGSNPEEHEMPNYKPHGPRYRLPGKQLQPGQFPGQHPQP